MDTKAHVNEITGPKLRTRNQITKDITPWAPQDNKTITDKWLFDAIHKPKLYRVNFAGVVTLKVPIVLKRLQNLRSSHDSNSYFTLLNRLKTTDITWISQTGKTIAVARNDISNENYLPIEFYHELSTMLRKISLTTNEDSINRDLLAKYVLTLLKDYQTIFHQAGSEKLAPNVRFIRNCLLIIIKSKSYIYFNSALNHLSGLKKHNLTYNLMVLEFYVETKQLPKLMNYLRTVLLCGVEKSEKLKEDVHVFTSSILKIATFLILNNQEKLCGEFIHSLQDNFGLKMDSHTRHKLLEISKSYAALNLESLLLFQEGNNELAALVKLKSLSNGREISPILDTLESFTQKENIEENELLFLQNIFPPRSVTLESWYTYLDQMDPMVNGASDDIKSIIFNSVLRYLSGTRNLGFILLILEHIVFKLGHTDLFTSKSSCSIFHSLIKAIRSNESSNITMFYLFTWLDKNENFAFNVKDIQFAIENAQCVDLEPDSFRFYLLKCYLMNGKVETIKLLSAMSNDRKGISNNEARELIDNMLAWLSLNNSDKTKEGLESILGSNTEEIEQLSIDRLIDTCQLSHPRMRAMNSRSQNYQFGVDYQYYQSLKAILND